MDYVQSQITDPTDRRLGRLNDPGVQSVISVVRASSGQVVRSEGGVLVTEPRRLRPFGDLEAVIMELLWDADTPRVVRDVVTELRPVRPLAYTTVMTVMDNLHRKGWLTRDRDGRAWRYSAAVSRQAYAAQLMNDALAGSTDRAGALARFVEQIDADDAEALAHALDEALAQRRGAAKQ
jgi:predicted transcriptional regulator